MPRAIRKPLHHDYRPKVYDLNIDAEYKPIKVIPITIKATDTQWQEEEA
jgi:hypothetical protein